MNSERGFSLVEVLVATMILVVGVMGLAASASTISRMATEGGRSSEAAAVANSVLDSLRATPCAGLTSGSGTLREYSLRWAVTTSASSTQLRDIQLDIGYNTPGRVRSARYDTKISCV